MFIIIVKFNHIFNVVDSVCSSLREDVGVVVYRYYVDDCFCRFELRDVPDADRKRYRRGLPSPRI